MTLTILLLVATDLILKAAVAAAVPSGRQWGPFLSVANPRFMLGIAGAHATVMVIVMLVGVAAAALVGIRLLDRGRVPAPAAGLVLGGALANTLDRAVHGAVQDFLVVGPVVVNLADLGVLTGLALCAYTVTRTKTPDTPRPRRSRRSERDREYGPSSPGSDLARNEDGGAHGGARSGADRGVRPAVYWLRVSEGVLVGGTWPARASRQATYLRWDRALT